MEVDDEATREETIVHDGCANACEDMKRSDWGGMYLCLDAVH